MKKNHLTLGAHLVLFCLLFKGFAVHAQGFDFTAINWQLPAGGEKFGGINYSFRNIAYNIYSVDDVGSQSWTEMDMNGDGKPDLVVYLEKQSAGYSVFGTSSSHYWKVYLNDGTGFSATATNWSLPAGGAKVNGTNYSFYGLYNGAYNSDDNGSQSWSLLDINGDSQPDLVVHAENQNGTVSVYGTSGSRYWKVYLNTGTGFSATATNWPIPAGGAKVNGTNYSFFGTTNYAYNTDDNGSQSWVLTDMDGDAKTDLVVYAENQSGAVSVYGPSGSRYWKVYLNTGAGFSATATTWPLPAGGAKINGTNYSFQGIANTATSSDDIGSQSWVLMDIDGDVKTDLVVYAENQNGGVKAYSPASGPYWKVYLNDGTGFSAAATNWSLPAGGAKISGTNYSFNGIANTANSTDNNGSQSWTVADMDGDGKTDLVVCAEKQSTGINVYSPSNGPYWNIYSNTGTGFSTSATTWTLPAGGEQSGGTNYSFRNFGYSMYDSDDEGSQSWIVTDMDGDRKTDLVVYAQRLNGDNTVFSPSSSPSWQVYLNTTPNVVTAVPENFLANASAYPNPAHDLITVKTSGAMPGSLFVITDRTGRKVLTGKLNEEVSSIDISQLARGLYFMQIGNQNKKTFKVIKE